MFSKPLVAALAVGFTLVAAPLSAQQAPRPAAPAPAPAATGAAQPSAAHIEAAKEVVRLSGIARTYDLFLPQLTDSLVANLSRTRPELRNDLITVLKALQPEFEKRDEQMVTSTARSFAGVMSEQALKDTAAFFRSEAGKAYVAMQPRVIDQMMISLEAWNRQMSEDLMTRVREEMRKRGHSL